MDGPVKNIKLKGKQHAENDYYHIWTWRLVCAQMALGVKPNVEWFEKFENTKESKYSKETKEWEKNLSEKNYEIYNNVYDRSYDEIRNKYSMSLKNYKRFLIKFEI